MKRFLAVLMLGAMLAFSSGCATTSGTAQTAVEQSISTTQQYVYGLGATLKAIPESVDALYDSGKISKDTYNEKILPIYNQALGSYQLLVTALNGAVAVGEDPYNSVSYMAALQKFLTDQKNIDDLIAAFGGVQ